MRMPGFVLNESKGAGHFREALVEIQNGLAQGDIDK
jgi:hypothetical protein